MMEYYTYIWYRTDNLILEPFYVGKGQGKRYLSYHSKHFNNIVKIHEKLGIKPIVEFYYKGLSEDLAYKNEIMLIAKIGRRCLNAGPLINLTPGGEGGCPSREKHWNWKKKASDATRKKSSESHKGQISWSKGKICKNISDGKAKFWLITYPDGHEEEIKNLNQFCKDHNLGNGHMIGVSQGKRPHHKGFKCKKLSEDNKGYTEETREKVREKLKKIIPWNKGKTSEVLSNAKAQNWLITYPDGHEEQIKNLNKFCKENNLGQRHMGSVASGKNKQHKGFKCKKLEVTNAIS